MKNLHASIFLSIIMLASTQIQTLDNNGRNPDIYKRNKNAIIFHPADEFKAPGMIGQYFKDSATATISNPLESNHTVIFVFEKVIEEHGAIPNDLKFIGSYSSENNEATIFLYGLLREPLWK